MSHTSIPAAIGLLLPPFSYQALLSAESGELNTALDFLREARDSALELSMHYQTEAVVTLYDPVPLRIVRVDNMCRAQLLLESTNRPALQSLLRHWLKLLPEQLDARRVRWQLEVDPLEI